MIERSEASVFYPDALQGLFIIYNTRAHRLINRLFTWRGQKCHDFDDHFPSYWSLRLLIPLPNEGVLKSVNAAPHSYRPSLTSHCVKNWAKFLFSYFSIILPKIGQMDQILFLKRKFYTKKKTSFVSKSFFVGKLKGKSHSLQWSDPLNWELIRCSVNFGFNWTTSLHILNY